MTHHFLYWLGISWWCIGLARATLQVRSKLVHCSCVCRGLKAHLCILPLILYPLWCELLSDFLFLTACFISRVGPCPVVGFPFLIPFFTLFVILLPFSSLSFCCSCRGVIWLVPVGPLWAYCFFFSQWLKMVIDFILMLLWAFLNPFHYLWVLLSHFFLLEHPWPICFPWTSLAHFLILHTHELLLTPLGFPGLITLFPILGAHGLPINPLLSYFIISGLLWPILTLLYHIMHMSLLFLSQGSFRPIYFL